MEYKKINYNNEQYSILTSINIGSTTFMICMDSFDNKLIYFKQEVVDGKVKLTASSNIVNNASEVNKKSLSNKKRILDAFCNKISELLVASVFVDKDKVVALFKQFTRDIDACDLKYYIIDNASIEPSDESIQNVVDKYNEANVTKDLEKESLAQNELYYFGDVEEKKEETKEQAIDNSNNLEIGTANLPKTDEKSQSDNSIDNMEGNIANDEHLFDNVDEMMQNTVVNIPKPEVAPVVEVSPEDIKRRKKKNRIIIAVTVVLLVAFLGGYFFFFNKKVEKKTNNSIVNRLLGIVELKESENGVAYNKPAKTTENYLYYMDQNLIDIDFDKLKEENEDIIAWIKVDSLGISYPVVKSTDDFYTNHDFDKESSNDGWVYIKDYASFDEEELAYNTVIYGANAGDGSLFAPLKNALSDEWMRDYKNFYFNITSATSNTMWQIASAYEISKDELDVKDEFKDEDEFLKYYSGIVKKGSNLFSVIPNEDDRLITLVSDKDENTKVVVVAKLIKIEKKERPVEEPEENNDEDDEETSSDEKNNGELNNDENNIEENNEDETNVENSLDENIEE